MVDRAVGRAVEIELRAQPALDDQVFRETGAGRGSDRKQLAPSLPAMRAVERPQGIVQRREVHVLVVDGGEADDVASRAPSPPERSVTPGQAVEVIVGGADEQIAGEEDLLWLAAQRSLPEHLTGQKVQGGNAAAVEGQVQTIAGEGRADPDAAVESPPPDDPARPGVHGEQRAGLERGDQPPGIPQQRRGNGRLERG